MFKPLAITTLILAALLASQTRAEPMEDALRAQEENDAALDAKRALAQKLKVAEEDIQVVKIEARTWNDSSLGCGKPGSMAMQVITPGYAVILNAQGREHEVHVSRTHAVVCELRALLRKQPITSPVRGLDRMMERAKQDLAQQLDVDAAKIRIAGMKPMRWSDSAMECPLADESVEPGPIAGYKLSLRYRKRLYTYHTDMKTVRACPSIERN